MFPQFNIHSTPLLLLVLQGLIFALLLLHRYRREQKVADLIIVILLLIMAYHRTTYTIGFMGWYDTFKNTKINYFLVPLGLAQGPLIYLYVRTIVEAPFRWKRNDFWHFLPVLIFIIYRIILFLHDRLQENWSVGYEGDWMQNLHVPYVEPFHTVFVYTSQLLYLAFAIQAFVNYRHKIRLYFSSTYRVALNWLRNFLALYLLLFVYSNITDIIDVYIFDLNYVHRWWFELASSIVLLYLGIKAYMTNLNGLHQETVNLNQTSSHQIYGFAKNFEIEMQEIKDIMLQTTPYLDPDITLGDLAKSTKRSIHDVSQIINQGFGLNFKEFINGHRVEEIKKRLLDPKYDHLSLVAIALDSGFNSKATFNRVFKAMTGQTPSEFKAHHRT